MTTPAKTPDLPEELWTISIVFKNGSQRVLGWLAEAPARAGYDAVMAHLPCHPDERGTPEIADEFGQTFAFDSKEIVSVALQPMTKGNALAIAMRYIAMRAELALSNKVRSDPALRMLMGMGSNIAVRPGGMM